MILFTNKEENKLTKEAFDTIIVPEMNRDEITNVVKNDELILTVGRFLLSGLALRRAVYISQKCRLLSRLLIALREEVDDNKRDIASFIKPEHFDDITSCVKKMAGYTLVSENGIEEPSFKKGSLPLKIGYALESAAMLLRGIGLRKHQQKVVDDALSFFDIFKLEWSVHISSSAKRTLDNSKFHKVIELPLTPDLLIVKGYLQKKIEELVDSLKSNPTLHDWRELSEVCITRLITFNKRRSAEPTTLLIERFSKRKDYSKGCSDQILDTLSPIEKTLLQR